VSPLDDCHQPNSKRLLPIAEPSASSQVQQIFQRSLDSHNYSDCSRGHSRYWSPSAHGYITSCQFIFAFLFFLLRFPRTMSSFSDLRNTALDDDNPFTGTAAPEGGTSVGGGGGGDVICGYSRSQGARKTCYVIRFANYQRGNFVCWSVRSSCWLCR
jgi:hypothetical protein